MESSEEEDPGPDHSFKVVTKVAIPQKSLVIKTVQARQPYEYTDKQGKPILGKVGDTRVEVLKECTDGVQNIPWLERGWHSKRTSNNFMKAFHYTQRLEQFLRQREYAVVPEVVDRELLRKVI
jgi:hypothetical protein